jgi:hypothetical protein
MPAVRHWTTEHIGSEGQTLSRAMAEAFSVTRAAVAPVLHRLEAEGFIVRLRGGTRPAFGPGPSRFIERRLALPGLDESAVWETMVSPWLDLAPHVANIVHYGLTEMLNNANDHSGGHEVLMRCAVAGGVVYLSVCDDGVGVFERMRAGLGLPDVRLAPLELSKGRVTTDPQRHTGEGIFFTSRAFPLFRVQANGLRYDRLNRELEPRERGLAPLQLPPDAELPGSRVAMALRTDTTQELRSIFNAYTTGAPQDLSFDRTVVPVRLGRVGLDNLLSRSQGRRVMTGLERFRRVELDFEGIDELGQAFADEVFRVWASSHPHIDLRAINAVPAVLAMVRRATENLPPR